MNTRQDPSLPVIVAESLQALGRQARAKRIPLVIMIAQTGCPFCRALREEVLLPMQRSEKRRRRQVLAEVLLDEGFRLEDFDGSDISGSDFARRYNAYVTPTMLVLDADGNELGAPIIGAPNLELYSYYLDRAVADATRSLQAKPD